MNNFAPWWDTTITIYNKYEDSLTHVIRWFSTVVSKCFYKSVGETVALNNVKLDTNNIICRIPEQSNYLAPHMWVDLSNDQKPNYFTLRPGDIIVVGEVQEEIDEYTAGHRSTDFIKKYKALQGCLTVQEVGNNTGVGRGSQHYRVNGI